jgi:hypothetical protein
LTASRGLYQRLIGACISSLSSRGVGPLIAARVQRPPAPVPFSPTLLADHTHEHTSRRREPIFAPLEEAVGDVFQGFSTASHSAWGRVVADIPDFCRELVAALAEG